MAGLLHHLGLTLGERLLGAQAGVNDRGFFENAEVVALHEALLLRIESHWADFNRYPAPMWQTPSVDELRGRLESLLSREFASARLWAVKDPRQCRLLPFWQPWLARQKQPPAAILMYRHPFEVVRSLRRRDDLGYDHALALWLRSSLDAEFYTRAWPRLACSYASLLKDWRAVAHSLRERLRLVMAMDDAGTEAACDAFLTQELRHEQDAPLEQGTPALRELALQVFACLEREAGEPGSVVPGQWQVLAEAVDEAIARSAAQEEAARYYLRRCRETELRGTELDARLVQTQQRAVAEVGERDREIGRLTELLGLADGHRQRLASDLAVRDAEIGRLGACLDEAERHRARLMLDLELRDAEVGRLGCRLTEADEHRRRLSEDLEQRDREIGRLQEVLAELQGQVLNAGNDVAARDKEIGRLQDALTEAAELRDTEIRRLQALLGELDTHRHRLEEAVRVRDELVLHFKGDWERSEAQRLAGEAHLRELDERYRSQGEWLARVESELANLRGWRLVRWLERWRPPPALN